MWKWLWFFLNWWIVCSTILSASIVVICVVEEVVTWHVDPALLLPAPGTGQECCLKNVFNGIVLFLSVYGHCYGHIPSLQSPNCYHLSSTWGCMKIISLHCSSSHESRHRQHQMMDNVNTKCCKKQMSSLCAAPGHDTTQSTSRWQGTGRESASFQDIIEFSDNDDLWMKPQQVKRVKWVHDSAWWCMTTSVQTQTASSTSTTTLLQVEMFLGTTPRNNCKLQISKWYVYIFHIFLAIC